VCTSSATPATWYSKWQRTLLMSRQSGDWTTASQRSASFSYSHGDASDAGAASQAAYDADAYTEDDGTTAEPALNLASASYAASDEPYSASEASFWQRSAASSSRAGSAGTASAAGSRPSSSVLQGASAAPDSPASSSAVSCSVDNDGTSPVVTGAALDSATLSPKRTATRTVSLSARSTASRASSSRHARGTNVPQEAANRQLEAWQLDGAASNASLSSWAAASNRLERADEDLMDDAAGDSVFDHADPAGVDAVAEADPAPQHSSQLPGAGGDVAAYDESPADAAGECSAELDASAAAVGQHTDANEPSEAAAMDVAADEEGVQVERRSSEPHPHSSDESMADMNVAGNERAQPEGSWNDQMQLQAAAGFLADANACEMSDGGQDVLAAGAAAAQLLTPLPESEHITFAAAAAAAEQLPSGGRLSVTGTGISMDGTAQARARHNCCSDMSPRPAPQVLHTYIMHVQVADTVANPPGLNRQGLASCRQRKPRRMGHGSRTQSKTLQGAAMMAQLMMDLTMAVVMHGQPMVAVAVTVTRLQYHQQHQTGTQPKAHLCKRAYSCFCTLADAHVSQGQRGVAWQCQSDPKQQSGAAKLHT
jgi:hypothetical protein